MNQRRSDLYGVVYNIEKDRQAGVLTSKIAEKVLHSVQKKVLEIEKTLESQRDEEILIEKLSRVEALQDPVSQEEEVKYHPVVSTWNGNLVVISSDPHARYSCLCCGKPVRASLIEYWRERGFKRETLKFIKNIADSMKLTPDSLNRRVSRIRLARRLSRAGLQIHVKYIVPTLISYE